jgi:hypothetical protein
MESRFKPGDIVWFQPRVDKIDFKTGRTTDTSTAVKSKIVQVQFTIDKVLYDLALSVDGGFYEIFPLRSVDSVFVCPIIEDVKPAQIEKRASELLEEIRKRKYEEEIKKPRDPFPYFPPHQPQHLGPSFDGFPPGTIICDVSKMLRNHH